MRPDKDTPFIRIVNRVVLEARNTGLDEEAQLRKAVQAVIKAKPNLAAADAAALVERVRNFG